MMPIGPLMIEHRLIEHIIKLMDEEVQKIRREKNVNLEFINTIVDFIKTYADRCHHGKEEDILFRDLAKKQLLPEHRTIMNELLEEHVYGRETVGHLVSAFEIYKAGNRNALNDIMKYTKELVEFYPKHIEKEDRHFFIPSMKYFSREEQDSMLEEFGDFDRNLIHEKYKNIVDYLEKQKS